MTAKRSIPNPTLAKSGHPWEFSNVRRTETQGNRIWYAVKCPQCGLTGKAYLSKSYKEGDELKVTRDIQFIRPEYETCAKATKALAAKAAKAPKARTTEVAKVAKGSTPASKKAAPVKASAKRQFGERVAETVAAEPKGYVQLKQVFLEGAKLGVPQSRIMKAAGGNRGAGDPRNENWRFVFYKNSRWLPKACLKELKALGEEKIVRGPKAAMKAKVPSSKAPVKKAAPLKKEPVKAPVKKAAPKSSGSKTTLNTTRTTVKAPAKRALNVSKPKGKPVFQRKLTDDGLPVLELIEGDGADE
jgi:hypothetical protein